MIAGRYRLVRCIGAGGMGEVWEAFHTVTSKRVAIKRLNASYAQHAEVRARFLQEARAACRVRHPNVVQIHDVLEAEDGSPIMVMDLLDGESLGSLRERVGALPIGQVAAVLAPAVDAIAAAHAMGIVHRDLKPDNLFLEKGLDGSVNVRVLDFGIAKVLADPSQGATNDCALTKTGAVLGTPYYMSPEQAYGEKDLDHRSDVFSLGLIIHECITGRRPTEADNFGQVMKLITTGGIPPLASVVAGVPADVSEMVCRMLSVARADRPQLPEVHAVLSRHARCAPPIFVRAAADGRRLGADRRRERWHVAAAAARVDRQHVRGVRPGRRSAPSRTRGRSRCDGGVRRRDHGGGPVPPYVVGEGCAQRRRARRRRACRSSCRSAARSRRDRARGAGVELRRRRHAGAAGAWPCCDRDDGARGRRAAWPGEGRARAHRAHRSGGGRRTCPPARERAESPDDRKDPRRSAALLSEDRRA